MTTGDTGAWRKPWRAYARYWRDSFTLTGRMSRADYWWAQAVIALITIPILLVDLHPQAHGLPMLAWTLANLPAAIAGMTRRCHDAGSSGMTLIPAATALAAGLTLIHQAEDAPLQTAGLALLLLGVGALTIILVAPANNRKEQP